MYCAPLMGEGLGQEDLAKVRGKLFWSPDVESKGMRRSWTSSLPRCPEPCHDKNRSQASIRGRECHVHDSALPVAPKMASDPMSKGQQTHSWHLCLDFLKC